MPDDHEYHAFDDVDLADVEETPTEITIADTQVLSIRLNAEELRLLARAAREANLKVGVYIKRSALAAAGSEPRRRSPSRTPAAAKTG